MASNTPHRIALLVHTGPGRSRESRAEVDLALAALALDAELDVYFIGDAILQLAQEKDVTAAGLPAGYKAWAALPDLGEARFFAESGWVGRCESLGIGLCMPVEPLGIARMKRDWRRCDQVLVV